MQNITSATTSINSTKIPAIYSKIDHFMGRVFDYGCGKYTKHIADLVQHKGGAYYGFDPYNQSAEHNKSVMREFDKIHNSDVLICANVLNVINCKGERENIYRFAKRFRKFAFAVYAGDKSGIGKITKKDCWQANQPISFFVGEMIDFGLNVAVKNGIIWST